MNAAAIPEAGANPFSHRGALVLVLFGAVVFIALLWMIGAGMMRGPTNDGGSHVGGKGLNGYSAMALLLEKRGFEVRRSQGRDALSGPGLLVLTPPHGADGEELNEIVEERRHEGPTLVVTPKWMAARLPAGVSGAKPGWVQLAGTASPRWQGFRDDVSVEIKPLGDGKSSGWAAEAGSGALPDAGQVQSGLGASLVPLVTGREDGRILAAYIDDGGTYPGLEAMALRPPSARQEEDEGLYPLVLVFEPDLLDNYGLADSGNARLVEQLVGASAGDADDRVIFDLTLNGHGRSANLLTLAFTPPFLAATLCLMMAAFAAGWRAFVRFGAPIRRERAIAFGKSALVANAGGLIRRTRRLHLLSEPYADRVKERIVRALALHRHADEGRTDQAIDHAVESRMPGAPSFTEISARLRNARNPHELLKAARELRGLERMLVK